MTINTTKRHFDSITELTDVASQRPYTAAKIKHGASQRDSAAAVDENFYGGLEFDQAVDIGKQGGRWDHGAALVDTAVKAIDTDRHLNRPRYTPAYAGSRPSVPRHLAGAARSMITRTKTPTVHRVIKIGVNVSRVWNVEQYQSVNRGAALLSLVHDLEKSGDRVELYAVWCTGDEDKSQANYSVLIKPAAAFFSAHDCAFALCHVAFQRRLIWAAAELDSVDNGVVDNVLNDSYGAGELRAPTEYDIYFPRQALDRGVWDTPTTALKHVTEQYTEQYTVQGAA